MIQRRHQQRNLFEALIGSVEQLIDGLVEPALTRFDEVLADDTLLDTVMRQLAQRLSAQSQSGTTWHAG